MVRNAILVLLAALVLIPIDFAEAQQQAKIAKIGWLSSLPAARDQVIRRKLRDLGYIKGKNIDFVHRYAEGKLDRLPALTDGLIRLKINVILTFSSLAARSAKHATRRTIPIVFSTEADPNGGWTG